MKKIYERNLKRKILFNWQKQILNKAVEKRFQRIFEPKMNQNKI